MENVKGMGEPSISSSIASSQKASVLEKLIELFQDVVTDDAVLGLETTAKDVPEWDSLAHVRLILAVERAFKVKFTASEISRLANVGDLVDLTAARMQR